LEKSLTSKKSTAKHGFLKRKWREEVPKRGRKRKTHKKQHPAQKAKRNRGGLIFEEVRGRVHKDPGKETQWGVSS